MAKLFIYNETLKAEWILSLITGGMTGHLKEFIDTRKRMSISCRQWVLILPNAGLVAGVYVPVLNTAMNRYQIVALNALRPLSRRLATNPASSNMSKKSGGQPLPRPAMKVAQIWATPRRVTARSIAAWPDRDHRACKLQGMRRSARP